MRYNLKIDLVPLPVFFRLQMNEEHYEEDFADFGSITSKERRK
jgi:hypothetical protein